MIELPDWAVPNGAEPFLARAGGVQRSPFGQAGQVNRLGDHFGARLTFPVFDPDAGRVVVSRLLRGLREGLRVEYPIGVDQGATGAEVVDGADQAGLELAIAGCIPGWEPCEGFWLSIENAAGQHFLHNVTGGDLADGAGKTVIGIEPMLRFPFADGARVHLVRPMIEGTLDEGEAKGWSLSIEHQVSIELTIEEAG